MKDMQLIDILKFFVHKCATNIHKSHEFLKWNSGDYLAGDHWDGNKTKFVEITNRYAPLYQQSKLVITADLFLILLIKKFI